MARVNIEIGVTCSCGYCSNDTIKAVLHFNTCEQFKTLPAALQKLIEAVSREAVETRHS